MFRLRLFGPKKHPLKKVSFICERGRTAHSHAEFLRDYLKAENLGNAIKIVSAGVHRIDRKTANADLVVSLYYNPEYLESGLFEERRSQINKKNPQAIKLHVPMKDGYWDYEAMVKEIVKQLGLKKANK